MDRYTVYGAVTSQDKEEHSGSVARASLPGAPTLPHGPIFFENPDGTITEAVPPKEKEVRPKAGSRGAGGHRQQLADGDSDGSVNSAEAAAANILQEFDFLYLRHERLFLLLLCTQALLDALYTTVFVLRMEMSAVEFMAMYSWQVSEGVAKILLWFVFAFQNIYCIVYYALASAAIWMKLPKYYQMLASWCLLGIIELVFLAYVDKFNLPIFFLRLLAYIYARFLQGLTASLMLLPPVADRTPAAP
mmetsp:Transcript_109243/g.216961  ORF Transcript_109243/g.216961 Transcript_109243/m.216961 type:complete len:247 (-) Transcript_109243:44-784(-)|eukprot:CAMPEP_0172701044 /NCGR_PEP_ID=MMETSP1074-20121228/31353_1 /TAXON_ID=2916 /ORGANISM="Ceratium fusus, Strain PA161109" /LENGTH=246 /DNA_ID=CAMNT_0013522531 /DNA_START=226 /DNA_END=966 /DNA_ORIENTATION=+